MKNTILLFLLFFSLLLQAQLEDCSACDTQKYTKKDFAKKSLYDLQLLRNEIFARHQYIFKDERLLEHFQDYSWYQPDYNNPPEITLNDIENANIALIKSAESNIKSKRKRLISELKELKRVLTVNDTITINLFLDNGLRDEVNPEVALNELKSIFSKINLKDVNWYRNEALYKVSTDNGFSIIETSLRIDGSEVILGRGDVTHSEIMKEPFKYGSNYYSENEYSSFWIFKFDGQQLRLERHEVAG
ncbi:YARHG domain-containing protein [Aquimarina litoralis]|uniref:YARHG domain-containing protein n=1 Tax=Aquimarina litoralis TaxID=584605 RepID=UPI001C59A4BA|nr:YARHG domain-containing protein [Aquimarina litoralis]MBW1296893.1 YARHG domain-containing protein [Aquimarina litoralis]